MHRRRGMESRSADFPVCRVADFQSASAWKFRGLPTGSRRYSRLETCATSGVRNAYKVPGPSRSLTVAAFGTNRPRLYQIVTAIGGGRTGSAWPGQPVPQVV